VDQQDKPNKQSVINSEPIAVVGMSCRFPGIASSIEGYWQLLSQGTHVLSDIPPERFDVAKFFDSNPDAVNKTYVKKGAFIDGVSEFDANFFGISPREAIAMDPQQRILLECSWEALEDSGVAPDSLSNSKTGVFIGCIDSEYRQLLEASKNCADYETLIPTGAFAGAVAGRLSYVFGFVGPSMVIDTHYSASLVALHLACQGLRNGECDRAIAGGVHFILSLEGYILFSRNHTLSPDGYSKTFDAAGDGFGRGEGCGVLVLKRLSDAIQDGDRVHAIIRGSAVNQDGHSSSMTAPNELAQENLIREALAVAKIAPKQISYIEAHGTGTPLGDPTEVQAIAAVMQIDRDKDKPLYLGSVKTNIGHLEAAAGIAGVIKTILALKHKQIPAHLHLKKLNSNINLDAIPAIIPTSLTPWEHERRIAGVSSFGLSGTNAHVILEEAPEPVSGPIIHNSTLERDANVLCISAKNNAALNAMVARYIDNLKINTASLADICFSANSGRAHLEQALAIVAKSKDELLEHLNNWQQDENDNHVIAKSVNYKDGKIAFLFTGGGAQYVGMGKRLYDTCESFKLSIDTCAKILESCWDKSLQSIMWGEHCELLDRMDYMQPALFALEYALAKLWMSWGVNPDAVIGHSLGEYVAATIAGVFSLEDGLTLITKRAKFMHLAPGNGAMASIAASESDVVTVLESYAGKVSIGAINGPVSTIISGDRESVTEVLGLFEAKGIKVKLLPISNASHSPMMEPILDDFEKEALKINYSTPKITMISNVTGKVIDEEISNSTYWKQHIRQTVRFNDGMQTLYEMGCRYFIEMGPQSTLLGMGQGCVPQTSLGVSEGYWVSSLEKDKPDWEVLLSSLGGLYAQGINVDWVAFDQEYSRQKVDVPTYAFQRQSYWVDKEVVEDTEMSNNQSILHQNIISGNEFIQKLAAAQSSERKELMQEYLKTEVRKILGFSKNTAIDVHSGIMSLGVTSVLSGELRNRITIALGDALKESLPQALIFNYPTVEAVADYLLSEVLQLESIKKINFKKYEYSNESIAIIGMSCRFPGGANNLKEYWRVVSQGIDSVTIIPGSRFNIDDYYDSDINAPHKTYVRGGAFIDSVDLFDAEFFNMHPREVRALDPQQRLLLEVCWEALENAGINASDIYGTKSSVFVGIMSNEYDSLIETSEECGYLEAQAVTGNLISTAAGRLSYFFGLKGPSISVDTACSSSLVAIDLACESLKNNTSNLAMACGVNLILTPKGFIKFGKIGALSKDSHCKTFDKEADGYARGEGCGVVVLKRFSDAVRDNNKIMAIIKASGVNQDGKSSSLTAPNGESQETLIRQAIADAQLEPNQISYIEAHGTGTSLGDPIEIRSLGNILCEKRDISNPLIIASVKTNIGHTESAAGIAGVIKTVLAMKHKKIPPHINFKELNPEINLNAIPAMIPLELMDWKPLNNKRIAGVSSFAISGTNAHVIIEESTNDSVNTQDELSADNTRPLNLLPLSANCKEALLELAKAYVVMLDDTPLEYHYNLEEYFADVALKAAITRVKFNHRLAIIAKNNIDAKSKLESFIEGNESPDIFVNYDNRPDYEKIVFLFTGQGSQYAGMGKDLYESSLQFKESLDKCAEILEKNCYLDKPLLSLLWGNDTNLLDNTKYTQPAIFAVEYALYNVFLSYGITPQALIGHSVGEYVAACASGVFSLDDGLKIITKRASLMQGLSQVGAMASIYASLDNVMSISRTLNISIDIAATNGPQHTVISGEKNDVASIVNEFEKQGVKVKSLKVSHAFHSKLLTPIFSELMDLFTQTSLNNPKIPIVSNLTGQFLTDDQITNPQYWIDHTRHEVKFHDGVNCLKNNGYNNFIEIGPHPVLLSMVKEILIDENPLKFTYGASLWRDNQSWSVILKTISMLYVNKFDIKWKVLFGNKINQNIELPTYPFQRKRYWVDMEDANGDKYYHRLNWYEDAIKGLEIDDNKYDLAIIFSSKNIINEKFLDSYALNDMLKISICFDDGVSSSLGYHKTLDNTYSINPNEFVGYDNIIKDILLMHGNVKIAAIINLCALELDDFTAPVTKLFRHVYQSYLHIANSINKNLVPYCRVYYITKNSMSIDKNQNLYGLCSAPLCGLARTIALEFGNYKFIQVDIEDFVDDLKNIRDEIHCKDNEDIVAFRKGKRFVARLEHYEVKRHSNTNIKIDSEGKYLITGGLGGIGLEVVELLVSKGVKNIVLIGRSKPTSKAQIKIDNFLKLGINIVVQQVDVSKIEEMRELFNNLLANTPTLKGIIHAAGVYGDVESADSFWGNYLTVMSPKILGAWNINAIIQEKKIPLDFVVNFSSISSLLGLAGHSSYASANSFLDTFSHYQRSLGINSYVINWGPWGHVGMLAAKIDSYKPNNNVSNVGLIGFTIPEGIKALETILEYYSGTQIVVVSANWNAYVQTFATSSNYQLLVGLVNKKESSIEPSSSFKKDPILEKLQNCQPEDRKLLMLNFLNTAINRLLGVSDVNFDINEGFMSIGVDSMLGMELRGRLLLILGEEYSSSLSPTFLFNYPNINTLSDFLLRLLFKDDKENKHTESDSLNIDLSSKEIDRLSSLSEKDLQEEYDKILKSSKDVLDD
jgi:acyl transferase domain-containing protein/NADP-dependent 3-hydroxy acid dehydrogenase YdfG